MQTYLRLLERILDEGVDVATGAFLPSENRQPHARRLHAAQLTFDMADGFPVVTTKHLWWRAVVAELIWFLRGDSNIAYLREHGVDKIWSAWVKRDADGTERGELGPVYGVQMRRYPGVKWTDRPAVQPQHTAEELRRRGTRVHGGGDDSADLYVCEGYLYAVADWGGVAEYGPYHEVVEVDQIAQARDDIRAVVRNPYDRARRRIIVTLWNPPQIPAMALPPCHTFHFYDLVPSPMANVDERKHGVRGEAYAGMDPRWTLNLHLVARSIDAFTGLPFNIASYALMLHLMAGATGTVPGKLTITFNDVHLYDNQLGAVREQLTRTPYPRPTLRVPANLFTELVPDLSIEQVHRLDPSMFVLEGYQCHPKLQREVAV